MVVGAGSNAGQVIAGMGWWGGVVGGAEAPLCSRRIVFFFFQAEDGIRDDLVTGVQTCALPILQLTGVLHFHVGLLRMTAAHDVHGGSIFQLDRLAHVPVGVHLGGIFALRVDEDRKSVV